LLPPGQGGGKPLDKKADCYRCPRVTDPGKHNSSAEQSACHGNFTVEETIACLSMDSGIAL